MFHPGLFNQTIFRQSASSEVVPLKVQSYQIGSTWKWFGSTSLGEEFDDGL
jgi:hypothetical protein